MSSNFVLMILGDTSTHTACICCEKVCHNILKQVDYFAWRYKVSLLNNFFAKKLTTTYNLIFFWICYLPLTLSTSFYYWGNSLTYPTFWRFINVFYLFLIGKSRGSLYQAWVPKSNQFSDVLWVGTLLVFLWSQCLKPLGHALYATSMDMNLNILARS